MLERGFIIGGTRLIRRAWQIYVAHIVLLVMYIAEIGYLAHRYVDPNLENEFNVAGFMANPAETLYQGLILAFKPVNMDVLPLYILLMVAFPPILWTMLRLPNLTLTASFLLYVAARHFDWNLAAFPTGSWYFNPFCWQFLFVFGGWFALGGSIEARPLIRSRALLWLGSAYLLFALVMTMAGRFPEIAHMLPSWLYDAFNPNDKTNLAPYRLVHFIVLAFFISRFLPRDWRGPRMADIPAAHQVRPAIARSLLCRRLPRGGAHVVLVKISDAIWMQIAVSVVGIAMLTAVAYYRSWSKKVDKPNSPAVRGPQPMTNDVAVSR